MTQELILQIILIILAVTPISYLIFKVFDFLIGRSAVKMGTTDTICTNITGNFTEENRIVKSISFQTFQIEKPDNKDFYKLVNLQNNEELLIKENFLHNTPEIRQLAIPTYLCRFKKINHIEKIVIEFFEKAQIDANTIENQYQIIQRIPHTKDKKFSTVIIQDIVTKEIFAFSKGNPREIINISNRMVFEEKNEKLTTSKKRSLNQKYKKLNQQGQKIIAYSFKPLPFKKLHKYTSSFVEKEMIFIGLVGLLEPLKEAPTQAIELTKNLGIKTYIISHKKEREAVGIGKSIGLINDKYFEAITGPYLQKINEKKLKKMLKNEEKDYVFCELTENDKTRIVESLKQIGKKVTVSDAGKKNFSNIVHMINKGRNIKAKNKLLLPHILPQSIAITIILIFNFIAFKSIVGFNFTTITALILLNLATLLLIRINTNNQLKKLRLSGTLTRGITLGIIITAILYALLTYYGWGIGNILNNNSALAQKILTSTFLILATYQIANALEFTNYQAYTKKSPTIQKLMTLTAIILIATATIIFYNNNLTKLQNIEIHLVIFAIITPIILQQIIRYFTRNRHATTT